MEEKEEDRSIPVFQVNPEETKLIAKRIGSHGMAFPFIDSPRDNSPRNAFPSPRKFSSSSSSEESSISDVVSPREGSISSTLRLSNIKKRFSQYVKPQQEESNGSLMLLAICWHTFQKNLSYNIHDIVRVVCAFDNKNRPKALRCMIHGLPDFYMQGFIQAAAIQYTFHLLPEEGNESKEAPPLNKLLNEVLKCFIDLDFPEYLANLKSNFDSQLKVKTDDDDPDFMLLNLLSESYLPAPLLRAFINIDLAFKKRVEYLNQDKTTSLYLESLLVKILFTHTLPGLEKLYKNDNNSAADKGIANLYWLMTKYLERPKTDGKAIMLTKALDLVPQLLEKILQQKHQVAAQADSEFLDSLIETWSITTIANKLELILGATDDEVSNAGKALI